MRSNCQTPFTTSCDLLGPLATRVDVELRAGCLVQFVCESVRPPPVHQILRTAMVLSWLLLTVLTRGSSCWRGRGRLAQCNRALPGWRSPIERVTAHSKQQ